ncbi:MAG: LPXTG cell wall anchor domain-containing protein, partial [Hydrococcus sp. SU_1_0]|nr:LPXTG cell wall anchor domain-containing protein [Hydrococcus sp. SU_1_0]
PFEKSSFDLVILGFVFISAIALIYSKFRKKQIGF